MNPYRPTDNEASAERIRSAAARRQYEMEKATRAPRVYSKTLAEARRKIEAIQDEMTFLEVWEEA